MSEETSIVNITEIVNKIAPILAERHPDTQGMVICELMAIWLSGFPADTHGRLMRVNLTLIKALVELRMLDKASTTLH